MHVVMCDTHDFTSPLLQEFSSYSWCPIHNTAPIGCLRAAREHTPKIYTLYAGMDRGRVFSNKSDIMRMVVGILEEECVDYSLPASKGGQVGRCCSAL